ncbi:MarR family transcriptional regulator, partial [Candidatus Pelagibacter sp.]|nr:MarR family transcriptional regulator [Candidatus Pelagibacter sp.]
MKIYFDPLTTDQNGWKYQLITLKQKMIKNIPSISSKIDEEKIFKIINENFSQLAPAYYTLVSSWLINAYKVHNGIDKFII